MMIMNDDNAGRIDEEAHKNTVDSTSFTVLIVTLVTSHTNSPVAGFG